MNEPLDRAKNLDELMDNFREDCANDLDRKASEVWKLFEDYERIGDAEHADICRDEAVRLRRAAEDMRKR